MFMYFRCRQDIGRNLIPWTRRIFQCGALIGFSSLVSATGVQETRLTFPEALSRVLRGNPELAVYPYDIRAAEARALQAGFRPNPQISLDVENIAGGGEFSGTDAMETTLALSQVIEMGGKRSLRRDVGQWRRQTIERDYELARLDALSAAASRYLEVAQTQRLLVFARQVVDFTSTAENVAQRRFNAGSASRAELSRARTDLMQARLAVSNLTVRLANTKRRLASLWGETSVDFTGVEAELFALAPTPEFASVQFQLEQAPQLQQYITLERLRQAELDLAIARGRQDIEVGAGFRRVEDTGDTGVVFSFSMPLGVSNRNQGNITAARENLTKLDLEEKATRVKVFTELRNAFAWLDQARERVTLLREQILPESHQALALIQEGYGDGRFSYLELVEARRQLLSFETEAIVAATDFHQTLITLETLTGQPLTAERRLLYPTGTVSNFGSDLRLPTLDGIKVKGSLSPQDESQ